MLINVSDILAADVGASKSFQVTGEHPDLDDLNLVRDLAGNVSVTKAEEGVEVGGKLTTALKLDCHRCLRAFEYPATIRFQSEFGTSGQYPISQNGEIDLAPLVREELIVSLPIKILCRPDCPGISYQDGSNIKNTPRIKKGK